MKVVIPMAGRGSRFANVGVNTPKPLIPVLGQPMLAWALRSLEGLTLSEVFFIALKEHQEKFLIDQTLRAICPWPFQLILIDDVTEGQLCTVLAARQFIEGEDDLLISSSDTYVVSNLAESIEAKPAGCHGIISVAALPGDRWSFARVDKMGNVIEVAEKTRISDHASTGMYYFSKGSEFVEEAERMIKNQEKTRGEYYVIPLYQKLIALGYQIRISQETEVWDMGNPDALRSFEQHLASKNESK